MEVNELKSIFDIRPTISLEEEMNKIDAIVNSNLFVVPKITSERVNFKDLINEIIVFWKYRGTAFSHDEFFQIRGIKTEAPYSNNDIYGYLQLYYVLIKSLGSNSAFDENTITDGLYKENEKIFQDLIMHIEAILFAQGIEIVQRKGSDLYDFVLETETNN